MYSLNGEFVVEEVLNKFGKEQKNNKKYTILFEVDFVLGNIKVFLDGKDLGFATKDNETLRTGAFYITAQSIKTASVKLIDPPAESGTADAK